MTPENFRKYALVFFEKGKEYYPHQYSKHKTIQAAIAHYKSRNKALQRRLTLTEHIASGVYGITRETSAEFAKGIFFLIQGDAMLEEMHRRGM